MKLVKLEIPIMHKTSDSNYCLLYHWSTMQLAVQPKEYDIAGIN